MTGRILVFDDSAHRRVDPLLPWFANGTLEPEERAAVERHLQECGRCRRELEVLLDLRRHSAVEEPVPDPAMAYAVLRTRLGRRSARRRVAYHVRHAGQLWRCAPAWTRWALAAQFGAVLVLATAIALPDHSSVDAYRTLGAATPQDRGTIVVQFANDATAAEIQRMLQAAGARIVDGPTAANAYVLGVAPGSDTAALVVLREQRGVLLAQPLSPAPSP